ncbi:MAG: hypothetical protein LBT21_03145 [Oscillospiraceae bacterium]|nr:hypothetical protein [Oscillospiraceae bacterium]
MHENILREYGNYLLKDKRLPQKTVKKQLDRLREVLTLLNEKPLTAFLRVSLRRFSAVCGVSIIRALCPPPAP